MTNLDAAKILAESLGGINVVINELSRGWNASVDAEEPRGASLLHGHKVQLHIARDHIRCVQAAMQLMPSLPIPTKASEVPMPHTKE